ncbi:asparagine synthetase B, partial [Candidatus Dojkabacteria bacterium]|nr:asparagine synthetase B [Candidatus Dojkabacteria bacterium]
DLTKYSVPNLLRYEDKNSMRFSVEGRVPFLDHVLVEYILTLPVDQKIKNGWNRYVYRNALVGFLPKEIEKRRKKVGFTTPESDWMRQKADRIIKEFSSEEFSSLGLFSQKKVIAEFKAWAEGRNSSDPLLFWRILNVHLWAKIYNISV